MARPLPALVLLLLAPMAQAESLYKCTDAKGAVSIQSEPCARGSTEVWKRDASPEAGPTPEELAARAQLAQSQADQAAQAARLAEQQRLAEQAQRDAEAKARAEEAAGRIPARKSECTLAHEFSEAVIAKPWLDMSQAQSERIKRWVVDLCRDPDAPVPAETES